MINGHLCCPTCKRRVEMDLCVRQTRGKHTLLVTVRQSEDGHTFIVRQRRGSRVSIYKCPFTLKGD